MEEASAAVVVDARGIVTGWSEGARRLTGIPADEAVGRPVGDLFADRARPTALPVPSGTVAVRHRDGRLVPLRPAVCPLSGTGDAPNGCVITVGPAGPVERTLAGQAFQQSTLAISVVDTSTEAPAASAPPSPRRLRPSSAATWARARPERADRARRGSGRLARPCARRPTPPSSHASSPSSPARKRVRAYPPRGFAPCGRSVACPRSSDSAHPTGRASAAWLSGSWCRGPGR